MSKEAMNLALEALESGKPMFDAYWGGNQHDKAITALREALAEQPAQQEPVAWRTYTGRGYYIIDATLEEAQRNWPDKQHQPLYTSPPQRTWVGLTDKEEVELWESTDSDWELMKRTEAKLKEKNT